MARKEGVNAKGGRTTQPELTRDRIVKAAYGCFAGVGIKKASMADIARAARVTRPTVYQYFPNKNEIIYHISALEARKLHAEIRRRCIRKDDPIDTIVDAVVISARVAIGNAFVRRVMESIYVPALSSDPHSPVHRLNREWWRSLIERERRNGILAADLDLDQIVSWLSLSQVLVLMKIDAQEVPDDELRTFVRRFIVEPLLAKHSINPQIGREDAMGPVRLTDARSAPIS